MSSTLASDADRAAIRDELKQLWDGLASLSFHCEDCPLDAQGRPDRTRGSNHYDFALGAGGRRALTATSVLPEGEDIIARFVEDGRRRHQIIPFQKHPESIERIFISNQEGSHDHYVGMMITPLWFIMPQGRPLYTYLDQGAQLEGTAGKQERSGVVIEIPSRGQVVRCLLDPEHDWLPRRIEFGRSKTFRATRYGRDNGRSFPVEIIQEVVPEEGRSERVISLVTNLRINRTLSDSTFRPPAVPQGVIVVDRTKDTSEIRGGPQARRRLAEKYPSVSRENATNQGPLVVPRTPYRIPWPFILALASGGLIAIAIMLSWRHSHHGHS